MIADADFNPRRRLAQMAARFHAPQPAVIAAVTGTNGKTSVAAFTRQLWERAGLAAASLGTTGLVAPGLTRAGSLTTPDPVALHSTLGELARLGVDHVALEASSHGLDQYRLDGVVLTAACFTNLTRDHLDYHGDMAAYFAAKRRLFTELLPADGTGRDQSRSARRPRACRELVTRADNASSASARRRAPIFAWSRRGPILFRTICRAGRRWRAARVPASAAAGRVPGDECAGRGRLRGEATGVHLGAALDALPLLEGAPGRMAQAAVHPNGAPVIVDYAHTPDALETVLQAPRPHCTAAG